VTELFGVVITLDEWSGKLGVGSLVLGIWLKKKLASLLEEICNGSNVIPDFQLHDVDPSFTFDAPPIANGISKANSSELEGGWMLVTSDSEGPVERPNSKSTLGSIPLRYERAGFFGLNIFSWPRWREKSRSIEDSSSVSMAEDIDVQAVAELPLLSEELEERPSPRDSEEPTFWPMDPLIKFHFRLIPFEEKPDGTEDPGESRRKTVSAQYLVPAAPTDNELPKILNAFEG
jgi:hypothetical protein